MSAFSRLAVRALGIAGAAALPAASHAQSADQAVVNTDHLIVLAGFIAAVIALGLFVARSAIFYKETDYDKREYGSKKNRIHDKYGSDWHDDYAAGIKEPQVDDHYATLGVDRTATSAEIKARYRELAKKHHPDKAGGSSDELVRINEAYEILSDEKERRKYDSLRF